MKTFSFSPISNIDAKILILGTMPGKTSLEINEYYGYKHNTFWKIMFDLFNEQHTNDYNRKTKLLIDNKIALWDSLKYCERKGSLDSDIKKEFPNDFNSFFDIHREISNILFNGKASYNYYKKYIGMKEQFNYHIMPSTSPTNAGKSYKEKLLKWEIIKQLIDYDNEDEKV